MQEYLQNVWYMADWSEELASGAVDAENSDTREILAMIARKGNHNVLVSDQIQGKITVHLKNVTWQEALEAPQLRHTPSTISWPSYCLTRLMSAPPNVFFGGASAVATREHHQSGKKTG